MARFGYEFTSGSKTIRGTGYYTDNERNQYFADALYVMGWKPSRWWQFHRWTEDKVPDEVLEMWKLIVKANGGYINE